MNNAKPMIRVCYCIAMMFLPGVAFAASNETKCVTAPVQATIAKTDVGYKLVLSVKNNSVRQLDLVAFYFEADMLNLSAVSKIENKKLKAIIPLLSPAVGNIHIEPGASTERVIFLDSVFPDLKEEIAKSDVELSWELLIESDSGCFKERIATKAILRK